MDELLGRRVPYSAEAEQSILGAMLIDPACIADVVNSVKPSEFYIDVNREIFETIFSMFSTGMKVDPVTVLDQMRARKVWRENSQQYLVELMDVTPTAANVLQYCAIVRERALLRSLGDAAAEITELVYQEGGQVEQVLELAERKIYAMRKENATGGLIPLTQVLQDVLSQISQAAQNGSKLPGLTTGLADIDECLQGLGAGDFVLIASRPGMGKTSIALNMAVSAAKASGKTVAVFSLEMSRQQLVMRLLSGESHIDNYQLSQGRLNSDEWSRLAEAAGQLSRIDIRIDDNPSMTVAEMAAQCRRLDNLGLVVVDYLQLMQSAGSGHSWSNESRTQAVSDISRMMKVTAKELGVPLICLSQLSRANEARQNKRPMLSDLRESGSIEQDADAVIGLYREGYYNQECEDPNAAEAIVLKNRHGRVGTVYLRWIPEFTSYVNDERHRDEDEY
ncbi:MAG: replicative DNA helicase [Oscillospiraceae bacterium]|nr:replicative DNA helicase [Oscillospiraceae bacterium]